MAKKKKTKKAKKKKAKKKKVTTKKAKRKVKRKVRQKAVYVPPGYGLHTKKLEILRAVQIMPCSAISRDINGLRFAHTQAEKVYQVYRRECESRGLVIRRIEGKTIDAHRPVFIVKESGLERKAIPCVRFEGVWEICDVETGQTETFGGAGDGDNEIWSANSAQTIARKQALLDYFETAWPQPIDYLTIIRESLDQISAEEKIKAFEQILPKEAWNVMTNAGAIKALRAFYGGKIK